MVRHIVIWKFAEHFSEEEKAAHKAKMKAELERLSGMIDCVKSLRVVADPLPGSNMDIMLDSLFENEQALEEYQVHPDHQEVVAFVKSVTAARTCMDFTE